MKSSVRTCESYLLTQADIGTSSPDWHRSVFQGLADRLGPQSGFPCPFSRNAFKNGLLRFAFVENTSDSSYGRVRQRGVISCVASGLHRSGSLGCNL